MRRLVPFALVLSLALVLAGSSSATNYRHGFPIERPSIRQIEIAYFHKGEHRYLLLAGRDPQSGYRPLLLSPPPDL
jgi:hypothetical protein